MFSKHLEIDFKIVFRVGFNYYPLWLIYLWSVYIVGKLNVGKCLGFVEEVIKVDL